MKTILPLDLKSKIDNGDAITVIDIREPYEVEICHLQAINIPMGDIVDRRDEIPTNEDVVLFCKSGQRAKATINVLESQYGFSNLTNLEGGILNYIETVDPSLATY